MLISEVVEALENLGINTISDILCKDLDTLKTMTAPHVIKNANGDKTTVMKKVHCSSARLVITFIGFCNYGTCTQKHGYP